MSEPFLSEIRIFSFGYASGGWARSVTASFSHQSEPGTL